jgi:glyoxylase-like metal-dependent hydrolase (beta-lactamase superfamily II)
MKVGPYSISLIETGDFRLDGGAMFGVVPKPLWSRLCPADDANRIFMTMRVLLIENSERKILVDCGAGEKDGLKFRELYALDNSQKSLVNSLRASGITPDQITDVILTHLHFDHAGGATRLDGKEVVPTFPKAQYYVQRKQYDHALSRSERDRASYIDQNYEPLRAAGQLNFTDGDTEILPGIELLTMSGHTPFLQTVRVTDGTHVVWFPADLIPMSAHIPLPYIMGYDLFPVTTLAEKKKILPRVADEKWTVVFEHDPQVPASRLSLDDKGKVVKGEDVAI